MSIMHAKLPRGLDPRPDPATVRTRYRTAVETRPVRHWQEHRRQRLRPRPRPPISIGLRFNNHERRRPPLNRQCPCKVDKPCSSTLRLFSDPTRMFRPDRHPAARGVTMRPTLDHRWFIKVSISVIACPNWISRYRKWKTASGRRVRHATKPSR